ncbi:MULTISPECIES: helix-turn-helix domain-containing protein [unclassified Methylobacterium]|uniref:helix-turn-helix domain-containing protein n=1 Tax=unclassified Methylobacterium TaxID=2615210 RepID=UPI00226AFCF8
MEKLFFAARGTDGAGFESYRRLYGIGADVEPADGPFRAEVRIRRFRRMILFERELGGLLHMRGPGRVRHDGFDHITLHLLLSGDLTGGPLGAGHRLRPGEIMVVDTRRAHWTRVERARLITVQLAREVVEASVSDLEPVHGIVLPAAAAGLLADFIASLVRRADDLPPVAVERAAATAAELLGLGLSVATAAPLARLLSTEASQPLRRIRAEAYIDAHLADPGLNSSAIAAGIGASRSSLYAVFADEGGIVRFIQRRRLERLRADLRRSEDGRTVSALAHAHGFADESGFNRAFRAAFGMPPGRYRAAMREAREDRSGDGPTDAVLVRWTSELY